MEYEFSLIKSLLTLFLLQILAEIMFIFNLKTDNLDTRGALIISGTLATASNRIMNKMNNKND